MASIFDQCEYGLISVQRTNGQTHMVDAWYRNDLAAHPGKGGWIITHMPSGLAMNLGVFPEKENAVAAMLEIGLLRNTWRHVDMEDIHAMRDQIEEIMKRHGAAREERPANFDEDCYRTDLNSTGEPA